MMKKLLCICVLLGLLFPFSMKADNRPALPNQVSVSQPELLLKNIVKEKDIDKLYKSKKWGQPSKTGKFWTVYSDRSHNTTYQSPSISAMKCDELGFNERVRIVRIENDFALVYTETMHGVSYPIISNEAKCRGWIPMNKLLLWNSCPANDAGIYRKALIVTNLDEAQSGSMGLSFRNPETHDGTKEIVANMRFYFVMKKDEKGMVLLSNQSTLESEKQGASDQVLYGWVSRSSFISWDQRTCLEPNFRIDEARLLKGMDVAVIGDNGEVATRIPMGREYNASLNESTKYRYSPQTMRYPLLGTDKKYDITAFANSKDGEVVVVPDDAEAEIQNELQNESSVINIIVVIDGTRSMKEFYQPMQKCIQDAYKTFGNTSSVKVGIVIYRDYTDGQYVTEMLSMRSPTDPKVESFLNSGGEYGVKSSPRDRTNTEALYKGLEVALNEKKMGYTPNNCNLMIVVGDCGNDENDSNCWSQQQIIEKCSKNNIKLFAFQVRNNNEKSFLLFRQQMGDIVRGNLEKQNAFNLGSDYKARFKRLEDGYEYESNVPKTLELNIGGVRNAILNKRSMEGSKLYALVTNYYNLYNNVIEQERRINANIGNIIKTGIVKTGESGAQASQNVIELNYLKRKLKPEQFARLENQSQLLACRGKVDKMSSNKINYWQPVIYISEKEFLELMEKLAPVEVAAEQGNRKPYVDALMALVRSMLPDVTETQMGEMDTKEITAMISGLNVRSEALQGGRKLLHIQDEKKVKKAEFDAMIADFSNKYRKLKSIIGNSYTFSIMRNGTRWYWLPVEDIP